MLKHSVLAVAVAVLSLSSVQAQDITPALQDLERTIRAGSDPTRQAWALEAVAEAYNEIGNRTEAIRLLRETEPIRIEKSRDLVLTLDVLAHRYVQYGDNDSLLRLAKLAPDRPWAFSAEIRAGDKDRLVDLLAKPPGNFHPAIFTNAVQSLVAGVSKRQGLEAAMRATDGAVATLTSLPPTEKSYRAWLYRETLPKAITYSLAELMQASVGQERTAELIAWMRQSAWIGQSHIDEAVLVALAKLEGQGNEAGFDLLEPLVRDGKARASVIGLTALRRLKRGAVDSGARLAERFVADDQMLKTGASIHVPQEFSGCARDDRRGFVLDRHHQYTSRDGLCSFSLADTLTLALGTHLARAKQFGPAKDILDFSFLLSRGPDKDVSRFDRNSRPCPGGYPTHALAKAYLEAGADEVVREYAEYLSDACPIDSSYAWELARLLTILVGPDAVAVLLKSKRFTSPDAEQGLRLGLAVGLARRGAAHQLEALLPALSGPEIVLYQIFLWIPDGAIVQAREKYAATFRPLLPLLRQTYLTADEPDHVTDPRASAWLLAFVQAGLAADVLPLIERLIDRTVEKVNLIKLDGARGGFDLGSEALRLGTLYLALLESGQEPDPQIIAGRLQETHAQHAFLALAAEALAMTGRPEKGLAIAERLKDDQYRPELIVATHPSSYAWQAIGEAVARSGDLSGAYRMLASHGRSQTADLIKAYAEGMAERQPVTKP